MIDKLLIIATIIDTSVIAIIRSNTSKDLESAAEAVVDGGIRALEFTMNTPNATRLIASTRESFGEKIVVGAGTVRNRQSAKEAISAGAQFIITPGLSMEVLELTLEANIPVISGVLTPTEVQTALENKADLLKIFPASLGGPKYIRALLGPYSDARMVATGGVNVDNAGDYIRAGATAVAVGGKLFDKEIIKEGRFEILTKVAKQLINEVSKAKKDFRND